MPSFEDLGLREELLRTLEDEEIERPTALQAAVIPALRRGTNLVARATSGAGKTLAYGLGVLDRLRSAADGDEEAQLRLLVLTPTLDEAERVAVALYPYVQAAGLGVTVPGGSWGTTGGAEVVVTPAADAMEAVRVSAIKLDAVEAVVVDGAAAIHELGAWERVDALLDLVPRDAQRVVLSSAFADEVQDLVDRRVKRALGYPPESALPEGRETPVEGAVHYVLVSGGSKLDVLARQLAQPKEGDLPPVIFCRTDDRAALLAEQLSVRGFVVGAADDADADVAVAASDATREELLEEVDGEMGQTISYDVPADAPTLLARHAGDDDAVILVEPRELAHLREVARLAGRTPRAIPLPADRSVSAAQLNAFREELRRTIREEDLSAQMLVLEPLFEEHGALEVAAAASLLLRRRRPAAAPATQAAGAAPAAPQARAAQTRGTEAGPPPATAAVTKLYVSVGSRDDVRPGDLVGALAGEANIPGSQIGKIDIRDSFSIVEVQAEVADQVIRAVNGTSIKGRSVRVDYDRGDRGPKRGGPGGPGGMRRQGNRPEGGRSDGARRVVRRPPRDDR